MFLFDSADRALLDEVRRVKSSGTEELARRLHPQLHPQGIQELSAPRAVRVAGAVATLLESLSRAQASTRLQALRVLKEEALSGGNPGLRRNTGRVLLQLMKDLVRSAADEQRQLELARDFRNALAGKPRHIRALLHHYHLLEMPEDCPAATFDDHVHDASTKGRKTPSHLLLDAWIKGIRDLTVVYYNHLPYEAGAELLEAAEILGIAARPGVEFPTDFHGTILNLIWLPEGVRSPRALAELLANPGVDALMGLGREVSDLRRQQLLHFLEILNTELRPKLEADAGLTIPRFEAAGFEEIVADGQPSLLHLAEYICTLLAHPLEQKLAVLRNLLAAPLTREAAPNLFGAGSGAATTARLDAIRTFVGKWEGFDPERLKRDYLKPLADRFALRQDLPPGLEALPLLLREGPGQLADRLRACGNPGELYLSNSHLQAWDVPEILSLCRGAITGLEIYNLKDAVNRSRYDTGSLNELRLALNRADIPALKRLMTGMQEALLAANPLFCAERMEGLRQVRGKIRNLLDLYAGRPLSAGVGSDSAGRSRRLYGMGLAVLETLPPSVQRAIRAGREPGRLLLPLHCSCTMQILRTTPAPAAAGESSRSEHDPHPSKQGCRWTRWLGRLAPFRGVFCAATTEQRSWMVLDKASVLGAGGNLVTLGGRRMDDDPDTGLPAANGADSPRARGLLWRWKNLDSRVRNPLKVLAGFLPAFLTFYLTRDWWVLACGGALIWFAITGLRNVVQAVLAAGGLERSHLLRWRSFLDGSRIADSLFCTGLSVPLLDFLIRNLLLGKALGVSSEDAPLLSFALMSMVNGLYISSHNLVRGLPRAAMIGNLFRSLLAIPLAMALNAALALLIQATIDPLGAVIALALLANCSAILTKLASDSVACVIEGLADRAKYRQRRKDEWQLVLRHFFEAEEEIELGLPDESGTAALTDPVRLAQRLHECGQDEADDKLLASALDMLYFWFCQPRARSMFADAVDELSVEQKQQLRAGLQLLLQPQPVEEVLRKYLPGEQEQALTFYRSNVERFLYQMQQTPLYR